MQITLEELLLERERRAEIQREMLEAHRAPLVSFTMNIAGPIKTSPMIERAFFLGAELIRKIAEDAELLAERIELGKCGNAAFFSLKTDAKVLKSALVKIEDTHPIGRLFDMDVIDTDGTHLSRERERGCLICNAPGRACAAGRLHSVDSLVSKTNGMLTAYFNSIDAKKYAEKAKESLLSEVYTYPKPGLVDPESRGSHPDMQVSDFERSAEALLPYFEKCVLAGAAQKDSPEEDVFPTLRALGIEAESTMYSATGGKNTHKGAIFSFGILLGAIGMLMSADGYTPKTDEILSRARSISARHLTRDLAETAGTTAGERAYLEYGARGIRGEAIDGFPTVRGIALPKYRKALSDGLNKNDAGAITLLHLIVNVYDTCLYKRGGNEGVAYARALAAELVKDGNPTKEEIRKMDVALTERNLSPGGCADLLAITYFLSSLED